MKIRVTSALTGLKAALGAVIGSLLARSPPPAKGRTTGLRRSDIRRRPRKRGGGRA